MMSKNDERKIIDSLANDKAMEMKSNDLEQMLNIELSKPENEIDAQLVEEILNVLEPSEPDPAQIRAGWKHVKKNLPKRQVGRRWQTRFAQLAATAAVISIVLVSTITDAGAFRWTLIQKFLKPVAETFGIIIDDQTDGIPDEMDTSIYSVSDAPSTLTTYSTLDEVPEISDGYVIRPKWIPEGFSFSSGSCFSSLDARIFSLDFVSSDRWFNLNIHITLLDDTVYSREFERDLEIPIEMTIGSHHVTFYKNTDLKDQSAFWIYENGNYMLTGQMDFREVEEFIKHME